MAILRAIGRFFAKIGRWIRDTAWVQPLLIVGAIFGLIFSFENMEQHIFGCAVLLSNLPVDTEKPK